MTVGSWRTQCLLTTYITLKTKLLQQPGETREGARVPVVGEVVVSFPKCRCKNALAFMWSKNLMTKTTTHTHPHTQKTEHG